jgi:hypothetical protein
MIVALTAERIFGTSENTGPESDATDPEGIVTTAKRPRTDAEAVVTDDASPEAGCLAQLLTQELHRPFV